MVVLNYFSSKGVKSWASNEVSDALYFSCEISCYSNHQHTKKWTWHRNRTFIVQNYKFSQVSNCFGIGYMCINFKYVASHSLQINVKDVPGIYVILKNLFLMIMISIEKLFISFSFGILYLVRMYSTCVKCNRGTFW